MSLNSRQTTTMLHFEKTAGESAVVFFSYNLVDEDGNRYIDESGNYYITYDRVVAQVLHGRETNTLLHFN